MLSTLSIVSTVLKPPVPIYPLPALIITPAAKMHLPTSLLCLPALLATLASAAPALPKDVAYTAPQADLAASLTCPNGIKGAKGGTVLL